MKNRNIIIIVLVLIILGILLYINITKSPTDPLEDKITKIESKLDSINERKDSIKIVIDSTHVKIITNEEHYKEVVNTIISQSSNADYEFITGYLQLRFYSNQADSLNNGRTSKISN